MNSSIKKPIEKQKTVRISKKDKEKLKGDTNWASLMAEEKKEGFRK
ncbi:hypothetical protein MNBD_GAMMA11-1038 [hydrothermal vent metagenome]|uniref:Uncharacterized protein n=1 Tax=hydrothermal vent metagenome TaxID=652676 RepID=A0A3B0X0Z4_9ZZZZ